MSEQERDRRRSRRVRLEQIAEVGQRAPDGTSHHKTMGGAADVSAGGIRFEARQAFYLGADVSMSLAMNEDLVEAVGNVVDLKIQDDGTVSMGIRFTDLADEDREVIESYCRKQDDEA